MREQDSEETNNFIDLLKVFSNFDCKKVEKNLNLEKVLGHSTVKYCSVLSKSIPSQCLVILKELEVLQYDNDIKVLHKTMQQFHETIENKSPKELKERLINDTVNFIVALCAIIDEIELPTSIFIVAF